MLSAPEARLLDRLKIGAPSASPVAASAGLRRTGTPGAGLEFQDYRPYQPGDDPRSIDWTVEARLRQLVTRVSRAEGHLRIRLLLDVSGSMGVGRPDKLSTARKLAAALCYVAIARRDVVALATFDAALRQHLPLGGGRLQLSRVLECLNQVQAGGRSALDAALMKYAATVQGPGLAIVFSDFFQETGSLEGLQYLLYRGLTPVVVQVLAPEEIEPDIAVETELTDIEDPSAPPIVVAPASRRAYLDRLAALSKLLRDFCAEHRLPFLPLRSSDTFQRQLQACERASLVSAYV